MSKRNVGGFLLAALVLMTGCATTGGRNNQTDIDALNARVAALEGQLAEKDQALNDQKMAREAAETAMRNAESERQRLAGQLESAKAESRRPQAPASDLK